MAIRFLSTNINTMGKIASGVTGISLKEDDEVIYAKVIDINNDEIAVTSNVDKTFILTSSNKNTEEVNLTDIKLQNRAGRGTDIMMVSLDDEIKTVQYN